MGAVHGGPEWRLNHKNAPGHTTVVLTPPQTGEWKQKLAGMTERLEKATPGGEATLTAYRQLLADVDPGAIKRAAVT